MRGGLCHSENALNRPDFIAQLLPISLGLVVLALVYGDK